jgi:hypothetical protein
MQWANEGMWRADERMQWTNEGMQLSNKGIGRPKKRNTKGK